VQLVSFPLQHWSPQSTVKHSSVLVIVQTTLWACVLMVIDFEVQLVQLPTGVGVKLHVPAPCDEQVMSLKQLMVLLPVHRPATSTHEMSVS